MVLFSVIPTNSGEAIVKPNDIKVGAFVASKKGGRIREILHIGELSGFRDAYVFYADAHAGGFCGVSYAA